MIQLLARLQGARPVSRPRALADRAPQFERRSGRRSLSLLWSATLKAIDWTGPALIVDISPGGMHVRSSLRPTEGTQVIVELPGVAPLRGQVRWAEDDRFGLEFDRQICVADVVRAHRLATGARAGVDCQV